MSTSTRKAILFILVALLLALLLLSACEDDSDTTSVSPPPEGPAVKSEPSGMDRFSKDAVREYGCPDPTLVPRWLEIPECDDDAD